MSICASARAPRACWSGTSPCPRPRSVAIRNGSTWSDDPEPADRCGPGPRPASYHDKSFREGFAALAALDLAFDAWVFQTQLSDVVDLAHAFPQTRIVLNHVGGPVGIGPYAGKRDEAFAAWRASRSNRSRAFPTLTSSSAGSA